MDDRMTGDEIIKLLDNVIGNTEAYGDSAIDKNVLRNLKTLIDVTNWCLYRVKQSAGTRHRFEQSMRDIGETAFAALCDWKEMYDIVIQEG